MEMNLYEAIKDRKKYLSERKAKTWIYQTLKALDFMHRNGIFHRDIKPENILIRGDQVKLADLGSCKGMYSKPPFTEYISTRWYRSPECILTDGFYNYKMDIWGLGCVFFEILTLVPLFPGDDEIDELNKINYILGSPPDELFQKFIKNSAHSNEFKFEYQKGTGIQRYLTHVSPKVVDLINKMLAYDPDKRLTAKQCLNHECFKDLVEQDLKMTKMSQINFYQNSLLMKSFNDSASFIKIDDSVQYINLNNNNNINNYQNNNNNLIENGEYTRYKALFPLINNITQLCSEETFEELFKYIFKIMSNEDILIKNSGVYFFTATLETIHQYIIIKNISIIMPVLCKYLTFNSHILQSTSGECLEKVCEIYGEIIIGEKSLFVTVCFLLAQLLISKNLKNKPKIHICLCFCNFCAHISSSNIKHL